MPFSPKEPISQGNESHEPVNAPNTLAWEDSPLQVIPSSPTNRAALCAKKVITLLLSESGPL